MKPSIELDILVAKKIMNLKVVKTSRNKGKYLTYSIGKPDYWYTSDRPEGYLSNPVPTYSTDIATAWDVVEKLKSNYFRITIETTYNNDNSVHLYRYNCPDGQEDTEESYYVQGNTASHAICLAALKAAGV